MEERLARETMLVAAAGPVLSLFSTARKHTQLRALISSLSPFPRGPFPGAQLVVGTSSIPTYVGMRIKEKREIESTDNN
jgi:hypothetical protein